MTDERADYWRILYIEDDEEDYLIVQRMLSSSSDRKIQVDWAASYEEGRAKILTELYHAFLVDYDLGSKNGAELIREFHAQCPAPFILYTSHDSHAYDLEAQQAGATLFLTKKDSNPLLLERIIRYAIERKQAERSRDESQERFNQVFQLSPDAVYVQVDGKFAFVNPAVLRLIGVQQEEQLVGHPVIDFIHPDFREAIIRRIKRVNQDRQPVELRDVVFLRLDGSPVDVETVATPVVYKDQPGALVIARDITERKRREARAAFMAEASKDLTRFDTSKEILRAVGEKMKAYFGVPMLSFVEVDEANDEVWRINYSAGQARVENSGKQRLCEFAGEVLLRQARAGQVIVIEDVTTDARVANRAEAFLRLGVRSQVLAPFTKQGRLCFMIILQRSQPYAWRSDEIELLADLSAQLFPRLEQVRSEAALRQSEARYRALYDSMDEGFVLSEVIYNAQGQPVDIFYHQANPSARRILGIDFTGRRLSEIDPGFDRHWLDINARVARSGVGERIEAFFELYKAWHSMYLFPIGEPGSNRVGVIFQDITERKRAEAAMAEDLQATRLLQDLSARLVSEDDLNVLCQEILNAAIELAHADAGTVQILEESSQELLLLATCGFEQDMIEHFAHVDARSHTSCGIALATGQRTWMDFDDPDVEDTDGSLCLHVEAGYRSAQSTPLVAHRGKPIGMFSTHWRQHHRMTDHELRYLDLLARQAADLIERQRTETILRESEQRFRAMADGTPVLIWVTDTNGQIEFVNRAYTEFFGVTAEQVQAQTWQPLVHPDDVASYTDVFMQCLRERKPFRAQARVRRHDGHWRWIESHGQPRVSDTGVFLGMAGSSFDIEDRIQAEKDLHRYAKELERSNWALQDFASIASHDLQEPLRKIQAFGEMLDLQFGNQLEGEGKEYLERIRSAAGRMSQMLEGLLAYSRVTSQGQPFAPVDLKVVAAEVLNDLEVRLLETGGQVAVGNLPIIQADALQMHQLLQNLIGNALKYHQPGIPPRVTVSSEEEDPGNVTILVQDNGIGIDLQAAGRIFKPFVRLHSRAEYDGSGIGLAICKKIVERHGGSITVESAPGQGTVFRVQLPEQPGL